MLEVAYWRGKIILNARNANYSFGALHKVFVNAFKHVRLNTETMNNALVLGFGTGSVANIINNDYNFNGQITGVEIDEKVIELGHRYFDLEKFSNLQLVCADASDYLQQATSTFDLIVVDIFKGFIVPQEARTGVFLELLKQRMSPGGLLLFNMVARTYILKKEADLLQRKLQDCFGKVEVFKTMGHNRVFIVDYRRTD
jgi:spermidine synthase